MKLSSQILKRLIAEELNTIKELTVDPPNAMDTAPAQATPDVSPAGAEDGGVADVASLRAKWKQVALDSAEFKGIDSGEAALLSNLLDELMAQARDGTASPLLRLLLAKAQG
tara:strand:- start:448 stop:783 length:336 start_codon:yes stop_codon:yes gene_type:complete